MSTDPNQIKLPAGPSVFLSHAHSDQAVAIEFHRVLRLDGFEPWVDGIDLVAGQRWALEIERTVRRSDCVVILLSRNSVDHRGYVQKEITLALDAAAREPEEAIYVLPVCLDDSPVPDRLAHLHWVRVPEPSHFVGAKYLAVQRALLARADQLRDRYDLQALPERMRSGTEKLAPPSFDNYKTALFNQDSQKLQKTIFAFRLLWEGGDYLVRGCNPTGDTYAGVAHLSVRDRDAQMNAVIGVHLLSYRGTFDGEVLVLTGSHNVTYNVLGRDGVFRGTWEQTGYEELIPASPFAKGVRDF